MTIDNILASILIPHLLAASLLFKIVTYEVRPGRDTTMREDLRLLWCWYKPRWRAWVTHPLYWAGTAIVTAFFLAASLKGVL